MIANVLYFLRGKQTSGPDTKCAIYAEIVVGKQKCTAFSTGLKVPVKFWMTAGSKHIKAATEDRPVSKTYDFAETINNELISIRKQAQYACDLLESTSQIVTAKSIREVLLRPKQPTPVIPTKQFIEVLDELRDFLSVTRTENTMKTYRTRRNNIDSWLNVTSQPEILISDITYQHFEDLQVHLTKSLNPDGSRRFCRNTINKHLTLFNKTLNYSKNKGYLVTNPIGEMGLEYDETAEPNYLLPLERGRIYGCKMKTLEKERDIAVFLYNTGLSYTDYLSLEPRHLHRLDSGEMFIKKERDKSGIFSIIPVLDQTKEVIDKYSGIDKLPRPDIADLNKTLKILGEDCKSPFPLSTSTFRDTFASMMENEYMIPDRLVMFMMGHTNPRQLRNYSRVMPARILHELKKNQVKIPFNLDGYESLVKAS